MTGSQFTVRIGKDTAIASRDDGTSRQLTAVEADAIAAIVSADESDFTFMRTTAVARASLAEAHALVPRPTTTQAEPHRRSEGVAVALAPLARTLDVPFGAVLASRRSQRRFRDLGLDDLATVLVSAGRVTSWTDADDGYQITTRPTPSAGARHPYELIVATNSVSGLTSGRWRFDPMRCTIVAEVADDRLRSALGRVAAAAGIAHDAPATIFVLGDLERTLSRYPGGAALVWRDAGALLTTLHLTAAAAGLASCIVGTAGALVCDEENLIGDLGALVLGRPLPES